MPSTDQPKTDDVLRNLRQDFRAGGQPPLPLGADEIDESEDQRRERDGAEAGPAAFVESERSEVRAQRAADKLSNTHSLFTGCDPSL